MTGSICAVVAEALVAEAEKLDRAVRHLVDAAAGGDIAAAKALIPWLNQALGMPRERVEHRLPTGLEDLEFMSEEELVRIVAGGPLTAVAARGGSFQRRRRSRRQLSAHACRVWPSRSHAH
jgi:hypothetical protein